MTGRIPLFEQFVREAGQPKPGESGALGEPSSQQAARSGEFTDDGALYGKEALLRVIPSAEFLSGRQVNLGKMYIQLEAHVEHQDRAQGGQDEPGRMVSFVRR